MDDDCWPGFIWQQMLDEDDREFGVVDVEAAEGMEIAGRTVDADGYITAFELGGGRVGETYDFPRITLAPKSIRGEV